MGKQFKSDLHVRQVTRERQLQQAFAIRMRVFVGEQGVPADIELDRHDRRAIHFLAFVDKKPIGTARIVMHRGSAKIGRMAVSKKYRRHGVGAKLLQRAIAIAKRLRAKKIYLHAQVAVIGFYERFGFSSLGSIFDEAGIPHRKMVHESRGLRREARGQQMK
ncbi:MAG: GNAT family N-acetyltransferase [Candidatus Binatia bacterium]